MPARPEPVDLAPIEHQEGIAARHQLLALGITPAQIRQHLATGRWQRLYAGVYAMFSGPVLRRGRIWAAMLVAGEGAVIGGHTALWLAGLEGHGLRPDRVEIVIPAGRNIRRYPGVDISRCRRLHADRVLRSAPPRLRIESALLDASGASCPTEAISLAIAAVQQRLTTAGRLGAELARRPRHRHRALLVDLLSQVEDGVLSPLELRYRRRVERDHGLPTGRYNHRDVSAGGEVRYRDVDYTPTEHPGQEVHSRRLLVELDGREAHPQHRAFRDRHRDNAAALTGSPTLRYGWHEVVGDPCAVAQEVSNALRACGWRVDPGRCGPGCPIEP